MLFVPKKSKHKKSYRRLKFNKISLTANSLKYGQIGLILLSPFRFNSKQLIMLYNNLKKKMKKRGRVFINIFPNTPVTRKPLEIRMGKGKGNVSFWGSNVKSGNILCEISTSYLALAFKTLKKIQVKLPVKTKIIKRIN